MPGQVRVASVHELRPGAVAVGPEAVPDPVGDAEAPRPGRVPTGQCVWGRAPRVSGLQTGLLELALAYKRSFPPLARLLRACSPTLLRRLELVEALSDGMAFQRSAIVGAALRLGIFGALAESPVDVTAPELAERLDLHPLATARLLEALDDLGYVGRCVRPGALGYHNASLAEALLAAPSGIIPDLYNLLGVTWASWGRLERTLRTGAPDPVMALFHGSDETIFRYYALANELLAEAVPELLERIPIARYERAIVGEVGLTFLQAARREKPDLQVAVAALRGQEQHLDRLLERYPLAGSPPELVVSPAGAAMHDRWGEREDYDVVLLYRKLAYAGYASEFLTKARRVLRPGGVVVVVEPARNGIAPSGSFVSELQVMDLLVGGHDAPPIYASDQIVELLRRHGFDRTETFQSRRVGLRFVLGWS